MAHTLGLASQNLCRQFVYQHHRVREQLCAGRRGIRLKCCVVEVGLEGEARVKCDAKEFYLR